MQYLSFNKLRHWQWSPTGSAIWEKALTFSTITQCIYDPQIRTTLEIFFACNPSHILSFATEIAWKLEIKMTPVVLVWSELLGYPTGCRRKQIACSFWHNLPILSICIMKQQFGHTCQHDVDQCDCREKVLHKNMVAGIACASYPWAMAKASMCPWPDDVFSTCYTSYTTPKPHFSKHYQGKRQKI
jgi:hypothetical protein